MERTKEPGQSLILKGIRSSMIRHVLSHNKHLGVKHLQSLTNEELLANSHPGERSGYAKLLYNEGVLDDSQLREYTRPKP